MKTTAISSKIKLLQEYNDKIYMIELLNLLEANLEMRIIRAISDQEDAVHLLKISSDDFTLDGIDHQFLVDYFYDIHSLELGYKEDGENWTSFYIQLTY